MYQNANRCLYQKNAFENVMKRSQFCSGPSVLTVATARLYLTLTLTNYLRMVLLWPGSGYGVGTRLNGFDRTTNVSAWPWRLLRITTGNVYFDVRPPLHCVEFLWTWTNRNNAWYIGWLAWEELYISRWIDVTFSVGWSTCLPLVSDRTS